MPRKPDVNKKERYNDPFPTALRTLIDEHGTKQEELKEVLDLKNRQSVTGYIDGETLPTIDKVVAVAKHYKVSADWLLGLSPTRSPDTSLQAAAAVTGLSEKALDNTIRFFRAGVSPELQKEIHVESVSDLSPLLESDEFLEMIPAMQDYCNMFNTCARLIERINGKEYKRSAPWEDFDLMFMDTFPDDKSEDEQEDFVMENIKRLYPDMRMRRFELSEMWSDFIESLIPAKEAMKDLKQLYDEYLG